MTDAATCMTSGVGPAWLGEVVVVIGPLGSGKSTLCRTINRLEPIDSGSIRLDGRPLPA